MPQGFTGIPVGPDVRLESDHKQTVLLSSVSGILLAAFVKWPDQTSSEILDQLNRGSVLQL